MLSLLVIIYISVDVFHSDLLARAHPSPTDLFYYIPYRKQNIGDNKAAKKAKPD